MKNDILQPLTIDAALVSLKAINRVFRIQRDNEFDIFPVKIKATFNLNDFPSIKYELENLREDKNPGSVEKLKDMRKLTADNISLFKEIQSKPSAPNYRGYYHNYYYINKAGTICQPVSDEEIKEIEDSDYTQGFIHPSWLMELCQGMETFFSDYDKLAEPTPEVTLPQVITLPEIKPIFKPEAIETIFDLLKDFFSQEHQVQLKQILETGNNASEQLIFLDNGNRLADAFKQLIKTDIITGCEQKELENWIYKNFKYRNRQQIKSFAPRYLNDIISTNKDSCQKPLLNVTIEKETGTVKINKT